MTNRSRKLHTAGLIALKEGKVMLAFSNNKKAWYLPGGKIDDGETPREALCREVREELNTTIDPSLLQYVGRITAPAWGEAPCVIMEQECFRYDLEELVQAGGEIGGLRYFDWLAYQQEPAQVPGVLKIFQWLEHGGLSWLKPEATDSGSSLAG